MTLESKINNSENQKNKPLILIGLLILFTFILSYIPGGVSILGYKTKPVDLFIDIKPDSLISSNIKEIKFNSVSNNNLNKAYQDACVIMCGVGDKL